MMPGPTSRRARHQAVQALLRTEDATRRPAAARNLTTARAESAAKQGLARERGRLVSVGAVGGHLTDHLTPDGKHLQVGGRLVDRHAPG